MHHYKNYMPSKSFTESLLLTHVKHWGQSRAAGEPRPRELALSQGGRRAGSPWWCRVVCVGWVLWASGPMMDITHKMSLFSISDVLWAIQCMFFMRFPVLVLELCVFYKWGNQGSEWTSKWQVDPSVLALTVPTLHVLNVSLCTHGFLSIWKLQKGWSSLLEDPPRAWKGALSPLAQGCPWGGDAGRVLAHLWWDNWFLQLLLWMQEGQLVHPWPPLSCSGAHRRATLHVPWIFNDLGLKSSSRRWAKYEVNWALLLCLPLAM